MCTTTRGQHFPACSTTAHFINIMQSSENNQPDRMEYHSQKVQQHCRVCGKLMVVGGKAASTIYKCQEFAQQLQDTFGITIDAEEDPTTFPSCFCSSCKRTMDKSITAAAQGVPQRCSTVTFQWSNHSNENCMV